MIIGPAFFKTGATAILNPSDKHADITLSSGNLVATKSANDALRSVRATLSRAHTDNGYFEVYVSEGTASTFMTVGLSTTSLLVANFCGADTNSWAYYQDTGGKYTNNAVTAYGTTWKTNGDIIGVALMNGKLWFAKNNVWQNSGNPAAGTGEAFSGITGTLYPTLSLYKGGAAPKHQLGIRLHASTQTYSPPSGFGPWDR